MENMPARDKPIPPVQSGFRNPTVFAQTSLRRDMSGGGGGVGAGQAARLFKDVAMARQLQVQISPTTNRLLTSPSTSVILP